MANYLNFTKVAPPAPNDPNVNEATQLNANWDELDNKLAPYNNGTTVTPVEVGQEYVDGSGRFAVWDGAAARVPDDIDAAWSAWTNLPMFTGRAIRSGYQPKWRLNSLLRIVQLSGGVQFDSSAGTWTTGGLFTINADASGSPPAVQIPVGGYHISPCAAALTAGTSVVAAGYIYIDKPGTFVRIRGQYMGGPGGGNFLMLEQVWWWY